MASKIVKTIQQQTALLLIEEQANEVLHQEIEQMARANAKSMEQLASLKAVIERRKAQKTIRRQQAQQMAEQEKIRAQCEAQLRDLLDDPMLAEDQSESESKPEEDQPQRPVVAIRAKPVTPSVMAEEVDRVFTRSGSGGKKK